ncbi:MAG TPA: YraN family protein [Mycobacteriales bacterium]|jgi:putative endonuclease|nr:YraN family protein [Mycobacteriales bacterium]
MDGKSPARPLHPKDSLGRYGEQLAVRHLQAAGLVVLDRNWRSTDPAVRGELDLVLQDRDAVVFCEVKTRSSTAYGTPAEAVSRVKQARLRRLARAWLEQHRDGWAEVRFDVVAVLRPRRGPAVVEHLRGVL